MWSVLEPRVESVRQDLARDFGCDPEELAITRNASEGMETLILGIDLKRGDEVIVTDQNYGRMLTAWDQRVRREGIVVKSVSSGTPAFDRPFCGTDSRRDHSRRTRVIEFPHIVNITGQILPVREIVDLARPQGIEVFIDGAHAYAHFPFTRDELRCDYFACSLHKWLLAPIGTGFLYVRKSKIKSIWPLMAAAASQSEDIRKYEEIGTHPAANHNAIAAALAFHRGIGAIERSPGSVTSATDGPSPCSAASPRVKVWTPLDNHHPAGSPWSRLKASIPASWGRPLGQARDRRDPDRSQGLRGPRVTPNIYATLDEIEIFIDAMKRAIIKVSDTIAFGFDRNGRRDSASHRQLQPSSIGARSWHHRSLHPDPIYTRRLTRHARR